MSLQVKSLNFDPIEQSISQSKDPSVLANIYQDEVNISVWQREIANNLEQAVASFLEHKPLFQTSMTVSAESALPALIEELGDNHVGKTLSEDIAQVVDMFCCLFELKRVGLRLTVLSRAMWTESLVGLSQAIKVLQRNGYPTLYWIEQS